MVADELLDVVVPSSPLLSLLCVLLSRPPHTSVHPSTRCAAREGGRCRAEEILVRDVVPIRRGDVVDSRAIRITDSSVYLVPKSTIRLLIFFCNFFFFAIDKII